TTVLEPPKSHLDIERRDRELDKEESMRIARDRAGVPFAQQSRDLFAVRRGPGGIEPNEYFYYALYDRALYDDAARSAFLGRWRVHRMTSAFTEEVFGKTVEKTATQDLLLAAGIPVPRTVAVYSRDEEAAGSSQWITDIDGLRRVLSDIPPAGLFGKPVSSVGSLGVISIDGFDARRDALLASDGRAIPLGEFIVELRRYEEHGYQFQERLRPHSDIATVLGNRIGTLRVLVVNEGDNPKIVRTSWKIPTGDNMADNFWRPGNLLAAVEPDTGYVYRVVDDIYPRLKEVTVHPDSGAALVGLVLPDWQDMRQMVIRASRHMTGLPLIGWDIALTDHGPLAVEVEGNGGHPIMTQLPQGRGLLEEPAVRELMEKMKRIQPGLPVLLWRFLVRKLLGKR
ncbi:MAG: sugar-transfer associated ATP-grasp domain-containing protein, partial [Geminicoccaceae bacterium]